jgi:hypothetical protein
MSLAWTAEKKAMYTLTIRTNMPQMQGGEHSVEKISENSIGRLKNL